MQREQQIREQQHDQHHDQQHVQTPVRVWRLHGRRRRRRRRPAAAADAISGLTGSYLTGGGARSQDILSYLTENVNVKLDPLAHRYTAWHKCPSRERLHSPPHAMHNNTRSLREART